MKYLDDSIFDPSFLFQKMGPGRVELEIDEGQIIFSQGDIANSMYYVNKGSFKVTASTENGNQAIIAILESGQFFGERCLLGKSLQITSVIALEPSHITVLSKDILFQLIKLEPEFANMFLAFLVRRNTRMEEDLIDRLLNSSERRLARLLLLLSNFGKQGGERIIAGHFTQETLAEMIGSNRSLVNSCMNRFRKLGFIDYNGSIKVHSSLADAVILGAYRQRGKQRKRDE